MRYEKKSKKYKKKKVKEKKKEIRKKKMKTRYWRKCYFGDKKYPPPTHKTNKITHPIKQIKLPPP